MVLVKCVSMLFSGLWCIVVLVVVMVLVSGLLFVLVLVVSMILLMYFVWCMCVSMKRIIGWLCSGISILFGRCELDRWVCMMVRV